MNLSDLIQHCRYYHGETENPFEGRDQEAAMFWFYEQYWAKHTLAALRSEDSPEAETLGMYIDDYLRFGLRTFNQADDTPVTLKAILFNRFAHWCQADAEAFKKFYLSRYLR